MSLQYETFFATAAGRKVTVYESLPLSAKVEDPSGGAPVQAPVDVVQTYTDQDEGEVSTFCRQLVLWRFALNSEHAAACSAWQINMPVHMHVYMSHALLRIETAVLADGHIPCSCAHSQELYALAWSHEGPNHTPLLAVGGHRGIIKFISCAKKQLSAALVGHGNAINELRFHPVRACTVLFTLPEITHCGAGGSTYANE